MKNIIKHTLPLLALMLILLSACNQKQFGHLSKVRVKQKDVASAKKESKEQTELKEEAATEEQVEASAAPETALMLGSNQNMIGKKPGERASEQKQQPKKSEAKKNIKSDKKSKSDPNPYKPNIPAYVGVGLSGLGGLLVILDVVLGGGGLSFIALLLSIPILILGIVGYSRYRREKASDGYIASIVAMIIGGVFLALFLLVLIIFLIFILSYGYL